MSGAVAGRTRRRWLAPEVVQTSAMDCGPASLKCLLEGHGVRVSYGRLREACHTDVDGTSIDTLEEVAGALGLLAEQVMMPVGDVLLPEAAALPALVVVREPGGATHFVVAWSAAAGLVQVMDPGRGRRLVPEARFLEEVYRHEAEVPAASWREFAAGATSREVALARLRRQGCGAPSAERLFDQAAAAPGWRPLAALDASLRLVESLTRARAVDRGPASARLLAALLADELAAGGASAEAAVPAPYWAVRAVHGDEGEEERVRVRGAVLLRVQGRRAAGSSEARPEPALSPELAAALAEPEPRPLQTLLGLLAPSGRSGAWAVLAALVLACAGGALEALALRGLFDVGVWRQLAPVRQRLGAAVALLGWSAAITLLELPIASSLLRMGRQLETRLRMAFLDKIPRLDDRYLQSRPISDMAERSHALHLVRLLPLTAAGALRALLGVAVVTAGLVWLDPASALPIAAAAIAAVGLPALGMPLLAEGDLRQRSHASALGRTLYDALVGLPPLRAHAAAAALRREHEGLLVEWTRAARQTAWAAALLDLAQTAATLGLVALAMAGFLQRALAPGGQPGTVLLFVWWALELPILGQQLGLAMRQYPIRKNATLRLLEPLGAPDPERASLPSRSGGAGVTSDPDREGPDELAAAAGPGGLGSGALTGVGLRLEQVRVVAAGHPLLDEADLAIEPGEQVAIVGASGAGKSTLLGLLLGWHRPAAGRLLVDGAPLSPGGLRALRRRTAWVDPAVQLWNKSLLDNLAYGDAGAVARIGAVLDEAGLEEVVAALPEGLQTTLGEGGGLISGGEGQRVRLARALLRTAPRLVLLDEPFRGLDRRRRAALLATVRRRLQGATLLCVTHDVGETAGFARVLVIDRGRIVEDGAPSELRSRPGSRYRAMLEAEAQLGARVFTAARWRRVRVEDGRVVEAPALSDRLGGASDPAGDDAGPGDRDR